MLVRGAVGISQRPSCSARRLDDHLDGVTGGGRPGRLRHRRTPETVGAMDRLGMHRVLHQWSDAPGVDGAGQVEHLGHDERISGAVRQRGVAVHRGDGHEVTEPMGEEQRHGVIVTRVAVHQDR